MGQHDAHLVAQAFHLANRAVISDIETEAVRVRHGGETWWDTRPMVDPKEHAPQSIDMAQQAIDYALAAGLAVRHQFEPHLLRIVKPGV